MATSTAAGVTTSYLYNGLGERVKKSNTNLTRYFAYDEAGHLLGEYDGAGDLVQETVWLGDIPVATLVPDGQGGIDVYYVHTDHLNTPRRITRPGDNVIVWRWDSDPFGATAANEDPDGDSTAFTYNLRFPGQYFDEETGLRYNYFRDYDAVTGRYVESDPIGLTGGINTYAYVAGNPLGNYDASGLECVSANGVTTCAYPGGPTFRVPTPAGFPATIGGDSLLYHHYDVNVPIGCADPGRLFSELVNNPTPGDPRPASKEGTPNDARVVPFLANPVVSYITTDLNSGAPIVVNIAGQSGQFGPGYVARQVKGGVAHTYGEGENWKQSPFLFGQAIQDAGNWFVWKRQMERLVEETRSECGCK